HGSEVIRTNLDSLFNMTRPIINNMRERGFGRIINISSINGQKGQLGLTNYCAAKSGVIGFTRALALESARKGITVNAIAPGYVKTDLLAGVSDEVMKAIVGQIPVGRLGEGEEVARCVVFLAADEAAWITGATLTINGGQFMDLASRLPAFRGHFEAGELEARRDRAADKAPGTETPRALPSKSANGGVRALAFEP